MNNLKPIMKEKVVGDAPNYKPGLLKKKPFGKPSAVGPKVPNLMQRLTGK